MAIPLKTTSSTTSSPPKQVGSTSQKANSEQFLTFSVSPTQKVMLATRQLVEILNLSLGQITAIADVAPTVMGVCNWRGEVLWVVDLAYLMGFEPIYRSGYTQTNCSVILVRQNASQRESQGIAIGLAVTQVGQMLWCESEQILPAPATIANSGMGKFLRGYWLNETGWLEGSETLLVLNGDALVRAFQ
ncbi:chemotaxis protein CheW [Tumidithrix elongata RA019]|uniref:Chemotaxis protein CheW n=1 Tax=Tumidithrix elongata BACA0141 TaxID=2716417 RepID=A0AAW9Q017_9CYAN|nr:chemotaxis protein CheW [Tumidithrix elongata RA019]